MKPATPWWRLKPAGIRSRFRLALVLKFWASSAIHPIWLVRPAIVVIVVVLLVHLAIAALLRDRNRSPWRRTFIGIGLILDNPLNATLLLGIGLLAITAEGLIRRGKPWRLGDLATRAFSTICAVLLIITIITGLQGDDLFGHAVDDVARSLAGPDRAEAFDPADPDIYVVLLDGYPGDDAAAFDPSFDADRFPADLAERGFDVERHSRSNYLLTRLTVATMLAGRHVEDAPELEPLDVLSVAPAASGPSAMAAWSFLDASRTRLRDDHRELADHVSSLRQVDRVVTRRASRNSRRSC